MRIHAKHQKNFSNPTKILSIATGIPIITKIWIFCIVSSVALFHFYPEYKRVTTISNCPSLFALSYADIVAQDLCLNWGRVLKKRESYRLFTNFLCFGGKFGMHTLLDLMILSQVCFFLQNLIAKACTCVLNRNDKNVPVRRSTRIRLWWLEIFSYHSHIWRNPAVHRSMAAIWISSMDSAKLSASAFAQSLPFAPPHSFSYLR